MRPFNSIDLKDTQFSGEKELRVSLSAIGIGSFAVSDGTIMAFPSSLQPAFDFKAAMTDGSIQQLLLSQDTDANFLAAEMHKLHIVAVQG